MNDNFGIEAVDLTKQYGDETAVDRLSLQVPAGTVYGFLGPNGAGKTTAIRMLTTMLKPTSGTARINGEPISDRDAVGPHIGYLPESPPVYDELSAKEQLSYAAGLRDLPEATATERIETWLEQFDLSAATDKRIGSFSKGMRQKVALIQSVIHEPPVLILDEPTTGLDPRAAQSVRELITQFAAGETTVFLSSHILSSVEELADTVGVLADGRLIAEGTPGELIRRVEGGERTLEDVFIELTSQEDREATALMDAGT